MVQSYVPAMLIKCVLRETHPPTVLRMAPHCAIQVVEWMRDWLQTREQAAMRTSRFFLVQWDVLHEQKNHWKLAIRARQMQGCDTHIGRGAGTWSGACSQQESSLGQTVLAGQTAHMV
jgi:hypothetical protein